jgi:hypothetical protein
MLTEDNLRQIGFTTAGDELGDDGALELYDSPESDYGPILMWIPELENGRYIEKGQGGLYLTLEYTTMRKLPHIKTTKQVQDLYFHLTNKKLKKMKKVKEKITHTLEYYA